MKSQLINAPAMADGSSSATPHQIDPVPRSPSKKKAARDRRRPDPLALVWTPEIVANAAIRILKQESRTMTGQFLIDEEVLAGAGERELDRYSAIKGNRLMTDLFLD